MRALLAALLCVPLAAFAQQKTSDAPGGVLRVLDKVTGQTTASQKRV